jgi:hypothetical protein
MKKNPFSLNALSKLTHIASGKIAPDNIVKSLTQFKINAKLYVENYVEKILTVNGTESFWKSIKKHKIDTFSDTKINYKKKLTKTSTLTSEFMFREF